MRVLAFSCFMRITLALLVSTAGLLSGCLPIIFEEERDLSEFEAFRLVSGNSPFDFDVLAQSGETPVLEVRFEGELWKVLDLSDVEIAAVRELSQSVLLEDVIYSDLIGHPGFSTCLIWDEVRACGVGSFNFRSSYILVQALSVAGVRCIL